MRRGLIFSTPMKYIFINLLLLVLFISVKKHENSAIFMDAAIVQLDPVRHFETGFYKI